MREVPGDMDIKGMHLKALRISYMNIAYRTSSYVWQQCTPDGAEVQPAVWFHLGCKGANTWQGPFGTRKEASIACAKHYGWI